MAQHLPLPFPVIDTGDLKRAIRYLERSHSVDHAAQRYVVSRARALNHADLLPSSWTKMRTTNTGPSLDQQLEHLAEQHGISETQLKTVYLRGVDTFFTDDVTYGSAAMYGLARVQRFISERGSSIDTDLIATAPRAAVSTGVDLSEDAFFVSDILYSTGSDLARVFDPGTVSSITLEDDVMRVDGELGSLRWVYRLDTASGEHEFVIQ